MKEVEQRAEPEIALGMTQSGALARDLDEGDEKRGGG